jgi:OOP family OmpA-OmpF porin
MDRKSLHYFPLIGWALVLSLSVEAQNLVPNPSFEEHDGCPNNGSWVPNGQVFYWDGGGVQYFNECAASSDFDVPDNFLGSQEPYAGNAYVGSSFWTISPALEMHPLNTQLATPLIENATYHVQFYVSLWDISWYAIKNMGVYFSSDVPPSSIDSLLNCEPQVRYEGDFISDKEVWTLISGSFVAQGGERFMTIGNFDGHSGTNTLFVNGPPPPNGPT